MGPRWYVIFLTCVNPLFYALTALEFDPDRFLDDRLHKYLTPNPYIFSPFNAGPRICLGQQFAYHEASFYLVSLLQQFTKFKLDENENIKPPESWSKFEGPQGRDRVVPRSGLTMSVKVRRSTSCGCCRC